MDADLLSLEIEAAITSGFLRPGDILVLDNAANHTGKNNTVLEDWLLEDHKIFALFLPAHTPDRNPIEVLWNCLEERLRHFDWACIRGTRRVVKAACNVLENVTHEEIGSFYDHCGVFNVHKDQRA